MKRTRSLLSFFIASLLFAQSCFASFIDRVREFQAQANFSALGIPQSEIDWDEIVKKTLRRIGKGGEGYIFVSHLLATDCYKKFHQEEGVQFGVASLLYARREIHKYPLLSQWITVPRVYSFGRGWIHRQYFPGGTKVEVAIQKSAEAKAAYDEILAFLRKKQAFYEGEPEAELVDLGSASRKPSPGEQSRESELEQGRVGSLESQLNAVSLSPSWEVQTGGPFFWSQTGAEFQSQKRALCCSLSPTEAGGDLEVTWAAPVAAPRLRVPSVSEGRGGVGEASRYETPVPPMLDEAEVHAALIRASTWTPTGIEESLLEAQGDRAGTLKEDQAQVWDDKERDFIAGLIQRVESMSNNLLWMPESQQFVWIDIF